MVIPIQSRLRGMSPTKSAILAPVASNDSAEFSFSYSGSSFECSPLSTPSAPPPTPADSLTDIHPRKSSFSSEYGMGAACAFPSWPNRPSLYSGDASDSYVNNAYLTDEDLLWMPENAAIAECCEENMLKQPEQQQQPEIFCSLTMEQQLKLMRAAAEEEDRARFMAKVEAHARATQAVRQAKLARVSESETSTVTITPKRKKRRPVVTPKRRAHSSSAKVMTSN